MYSSPYCSPVFGFVDGETFIIEPFLFLKAGFPLRYIKPRPNSSFANTVWRAGIPLNWLPSQLKNASCSAVEKKSLSNPLPTGPPHVPKLEGNIWANIIPSNSGPKFGVHTVSSVNLLKSYLEKPFLLNGLKFDLRLYVLLTSIEPMRIFLFKDGLVRFAT